MSDSVQHLRRQPTRLLCPWDSPGKNTGVGCHFLLQCMKVKSQSEVAQSCPTLSDLMDCSPPGSSIHGIFQARGLEWGAISSIKKEFFQLLLVLIICCYCCLWGHSIVFRGRPPPPTPEMFVLLESKIDFPKPHPWKPKWTNPLNLEDGLFCPVPISPRGCSRTCDTPKAQSKHTRLLILEKPDGGLSSSRC